MYVTSLFVDMFTSHLCTYSPIHLFAYSQQNSSGMSAQKYF